MFLKFEKKEYATKHRKNEKPMDKDKFVKTNFDTSPSNAQIK